MTETTHTPATAPTVEEIQATMDRLRSGPIPRPLAPIRMHPMTWRVLWTWTKPAPADERVLAGVLGVPVSEDAGIPYGWVEIEGDRCICIVEPVLPCAPDAGTERESGGWMSGYWPDESRGPTAFKGLYDYRAQLAAKQNRQGPPPPVGISRKGAKG